MKKVTAGIISILMLVSLAGCFGKPNGNIEFAKVSMAIDETDMYTYAGTVDYIFIGKVTECVSYRVSRNVSYSVFNITVVENLKGSLKSSIQVKKFGGYKRDGTLVLCESDRIRDTGLPNVGSQYIFMAYAQQDGSLLLSEFHGNVDYSGAEQRTQYLDYIKNEKPFDRQRFKSMYELEDSEKEVSASESLLLFSSLSADNIARVSTVRLPGNDKLEIEAGDEKIAKLAELLKKTGTCEALPEKDNNTNGMLVEITITLSDKSVLRIVTGETNVIRLNGTRFSVQTDITEPLNTLLYGELKPAN